jgi:hypothetical protein
VSYVYRLTGHSQTIAQYLRQLFAAAPFVVVKVEGIAELMVVPIERIF